ncbi:hypothetical protein LSAT2_000955 [Lamellibrachia satsuma]|nr:hypothetical protein LSAT2_000955 [Lamellibrachia satsuma]
MTDTGLWSTPSPDLEDLDDRNSTGVFTGLDDVRFAGLWRSVWPLLCVTGIVGNSLVLLVLRREGLARTSANVYLSVLAIGDSSVLAVASVAFYPRLAWDVRLDETSVWACRVIWFVHHTLANASNWTVVAFTVERFIAVRFPLRKLRVCTPRNAGVWCASLLALALVKNADVFIVFAPHVDDSGDVIVGCALAPRYFNYVFDYRPWINFATVSIVPFGVVVFCNWAIIRELRRTAADRDLIMSAVIDRLPRTTIMCMSVSVAFVVCVVSGSVVVIIHRYRHVRADVMQAFFLLRYASHAINFFLYCLTGTHFRRELAALLGDCNDCMATVTRRFRSRIGRGSGNNIEMR